MHSKKIMAGVLGVLATTFILSGCGSTSNGTAASAGSSSKPAAKKGPYTIGYDIYFAGNSWSVQLADEFKAEAAKHKSEIKQVDYTESNGDINTQISNIKSLIAKHVDAIIVTPNSPTALIPVLKEARQKGIVVVLLAATINSPDYDSLVTVDDTDFGKVGAEWLVKQLNGKGNIIVLNGMAGISVSQDRWNGAESVFKSYPGIHVIASANANWDYATGKTAVSNMLAAHPEKIDGVWSQGGSMTMGAIEAFQAAHRPLVPMTGEDNNGFLKMWAKLEPQGFQAIGVSKPTWLSADALDTTLDILDGKPYKKDNVLQPPTITNSDLSKYVKPNMSDSMYDNTKLSNSELQQLFSK
ncbi:ABC transporter substrate-binding protein [Alicyclobacillus dauci]|uniref:ABC transporter substrate-binding protein n=1 Tax=Alicyclobacillus dauci TaxID=1475485 RepID=A0ABY6Z9I6_9BACL|nr:ABC transporter substrate-binding protein [Alicyclobacillus dauci]WAH36364.1 ABC transporter substrate-binding protein [Alicyclobacillus dauci]WAH39370.1 ABC transporter substrate-binding protein [Alicyclobacillus dauci]